MRSRPVLAHEIGHVAYRHVGKSRSAREIAVLSKKAQSATGSALYQASYTTLQEQQADRVGLLYDALAGFNPAVAPGIWERAAKKFGSNPGQFLYDHPLNSDRQKQLAAIVPLAAHYYRGEGIENPHYKEILAANQLIRRSNSSSGNGFLDLASGALGTYNEYLRAKNEALQREIAMNQRALALRQVTQLTFRIAPTADGHQGLFGEVRNVGTRTITNLQIAVYYYAARGAVLHTQTISLGTRQLSPGARAAWSNYLLTVPNAVRVAAGVIAGKFLQ